MAIFEKFNEAWESRNIDKLAEFFHPDWEFQFHSTGKVIKLCLLYTSPSPRD